MLSITLINNDNYDIIQEKYFVKNTNKEQNLITLNTIEIIKDIGLLSNSNNITLKVDNNLIIFVKSKESKLSILIQFENIRYNSTDAIDISKSILGILEKRYFTENVNKIYVIDLNLKEILFASIEDITASFLEMLRKNKLFAKFLYFNYNPSASGAFKCKKLKQESASVILFNAKSDFEKDTNKDTMLQKSTMKEKELWIDMDKKSFPPCDKKILIKKISSLKPDQMKKKSLFKYYVGNSYIEKYVSIID